MMLSKNVCYMFNPEKLKEEFSKELPRKFFWKFSGAFPNNFVQQFPKALTK